jgi:hypothetical protein
LWKASPRGRAGASCPGDQTTLELDGKQGKGEAQTVSGTLCLLPLSPALLCGSCSLRLETCSPPTFCEGKSLGLLSPIHSRGEASQPDSSAKYPVFQFLPPPYTWKTSPLPFTHWLWLELKSDLGWASTLPSSPCGSPACPPSASPGSQKARTQDARC